MNHKILSGLVAWGVLLTLLVAAGCGSSSSTTNDSAPPSMTIVYSHSAVFRNNTTFTSGYNAFGQLASSNLDQREGFSPVTGLGHTDGVSVGADHTLAFQNNSTMYAWGSNQTAQLGNGVSGSGQHSRLPLRVELSAGVPLSGVKSAAAGYYHSLAATDGGTKVYAWGNNSFGQLGLGTGSGDNFDSKDRPTPVNLTLPAGVTVKKVAAGNQFSLALLSDGTVYAWGDNVLGQLAIDKTTVKRSTPGNVTVDGTPLTKIVDIAAGVGFSIALDSDGNVWAWGDNSVGQLGENPAGLADRHTPTQIPSLSGVTQIAAGAFHALALLNTGEVRAWGLDFFGELGDNNKDAVSHAVRVGDTTTSASYTPVAVITDGNGDSGTHLGNVGRIYAYADSSFAQTATNLYVWGNNRRGQLGIPITTTNVGYLLLATPVTGF